MPPATRRVSLKTIPGLSRLTRFDYIEASVSSLLNELHSLRVEYINKQDSNAKKGRYNKVMQKTQAKFREVKDKWRCDRSREFQSAADTNNAKKFISKLMTVYGPSSKGSSPLFDLDGNTVIKEPTLIQRYGHRTSTSCLAVFQ